MLLKYSLKKTRIKVDSQATLMTNLNSFNRVRSLISQAFCVAYSELSRLMIWKLARMFGSEIKGKESYD